MTTHTISIRESFKNAWEITKTNIWFLILSMLAFILLTIPFQGIFILKTVVDSFIILGWSSLVLVLVSGKKPSIHDITKPFATYHKPLRMLIIYLLVSLATLAGLVLFILPGIYIGVRFMFFPYYVLEHHHKTIRESLKEIFAITENKFWKLFLFCIVVGVVNTLGFLALGVGFFITFPLSMIATGYLYTQLTPHHKRIA